MSDGLDLKLTEWIASGTAVTNCELDRDERPLMPSRMIVWML